MHHDLPSKDGNGTSSPMKFKQLLHDPDWVYQKVISSHNPKRSSNSLAHSMKFITKINPSVTITTSKAPSFVMISEVLAWNKSPFHGTWYEH